MYNYSYRVMWSEEDGEYVATTPEFPLLSALAATPQEALAELSMVVEAVIEDYQEEGDELPEPQYVIDYSGQFRLRMPKSLHAQLAAEAEREGVSMNMLAVRYLAQGLGEARGQKRLAPEPA